MQRQSLGSPASKLHGHGASSSALSSAKDDALVVDDSSSSSSASKRRDSFLSSASLLLPHYDDDKSSRPHRLSLAAASSSSSSSSSSASALSPRKPEKLIHLIPLLTLFCFLVLYLCSHSPSQTDLAQFSGFKRPAKQIVATDIDEISRFSEVRRGDALAIRSRRSLREVGRRSQPQRSRAVHRKFADF
ncbi:uncharacterized protein LOC115685475 [Syzygium oleosum]|uniref:uncharacterized protein LOC115685475 n=1 Tax=Syzygium oleosum TaxID=219896 RepID=UPI0011D225F5|nr:uncharacterized protein LOC115685475 [Syzygium oleosum]